MIDPGGRVPARVDQTKTLLTHPRTQSPRRAKLQRGKATGRVRQFRTQHGVRNADVKQLGDPVANGMTFDTLC